MRKIVNVVALWILLATAIFVRDFPWSTQKVAEVCVVAPVPETKTNNYESRGFGHPEFEEFPELADKLTVQRKLRDERRTAMEADPTIIDAKLVRTYSYSYQFTHNPPKFPSPITGAPKRMPYADK